MKNVLVRNQTTGKCKLLASGSEPTLVSNWEHFSVSIYYICDDPRSQKYGHVIRISKIREWKMFRIVQYTC